jgi:hypothetical protein
VTEGSGVSTMLVPPLCSLLEVKLDKVHVYIFMDVLFGVKK